MRIVDIVSYDGKTISIDLGNDTDYGGIGHSQAVIDAVEPAS